MKVQLGKKYKDIVHGIEGVAVTYCNYLTGCDRVSLDYIDKNGNLKSHFVDVTRCEEITKFKQIKIPTQKTEDGEKTGGPGTLISKPAVM